MQHTLPLESFEPPYEPDQFTPEDEWHVKPFFTNLDKSVYVPLIFSPEIIGALCSRTSRAAGDLRTIFLNEYIRPFLSGDQVNQEYGRALHDFISFLHLHPIESIFSNPRARSFYAKWLAQYGDDSIAQMAGAHLVFSSLSQIAIKHFEDQRIGLAPIEKSTRYVDYSSKVKDQYRYYTDPTLQAIGLEAEYRRAMDGLFETYVQLQKPFVAWLQERFPAEKPGVIEKKAFDTLRGLLPLSTLSQVAFFGNGQSFEYLVSRSARHPLGEIRWAAEQTYEELFKVTPSFLRRIKDPERQELVQNYQDYLSGKGKRLLPLVEPFITEPNVLARSTTVALVEHDREGENKMMAAMLFSAPTNHRSWNETLNYVRDLTDERKKAIIDMYFAGRTQRWQKVGRALENVYVRFEIVMNIGAWRDLHRHRLLTQQRQHFSCEHGYDTPPEIIQAGLEHDFRTAIESAEAVQRKIAVYDVDLAQYAVTMAHRVRFMQWQNLRECFWEIELRTIPEGHPDYRHVEQAKWRLLARVYPLIAERMHVNLGEYDFARRGQEEKINAKLAELENLQAQGITK